jgi:hypothetical protein
MKKAKLSKNQQEVIDKMRAGWELGQDMSFQGWAWLQKGGLGKGGESMNVKLNTFHSLRERGIIRCVSQKFPTARYELSDEWK